MLRAVSILSKSLRLKFLLSNVGLGQFDGIVFCNIRKSSEFKRLVRREQAIRARGSEAIYGHFLSLRRRPRGRAVE